MAEGTHDGWLCSKGMWRVPEVKGGETGKGGQRAKGMAGLLLEGRITGHELQRTVKRAPQG